MVCVARRTLRRIGALASAPVLVIWLSCCELGRCTPFETIGSWRIPVRFVGLRWTTFHQGPAEFAPWLDIKCEAEFLGAGERREMQVTMFAVGFHEVAELESRLGGRVFDPCVSLEGLPVAITDSVSISEEGDSFRRWCRYLGPAGGKATIVRDVFAFASTEEVLRIELWSLPGEEWSKDRCVDFLRRVVRK
jgi:hypothetical protein